jgi:hypothetical protein
LIYDQYEWKIAPQKTDGFDDATADLLIDNLGLPVSEVGSAMEVKALSKLCSAMWYFQIVPSRYHGVRLVTDASGVMAQNASPTLSPALTPVTGGPGPLASEPAHWCWNSESNDSTETSLKLANIALVLGRREMFEREIKTVIWNWADETRAGTATTPVQCLRNEGVEGLDSTSQRKMNELGSIKLTTAREKRAGKGKGH